MTILGVVVFRAEIALKPIVRVSDLLVANGPDIEVGWGGEGAVCGVGQCSHRVAGATQSTDDPGLA